MTRCRSMISRTLSFAPLPLALAAAHCGADDASPTPNDTTGATTACATPPASPTPVDPQTGWPAQDANVKTHRFFTITVVDAATHAPIAGAELRTTNNIVYTTDNKGVVAFYEPGLMDTDVFLAMSRQGYEHKADFFGYRGEAVHPTEGGSKELSMDKIGDAPAIAAGDLQSRLTKGNVPGAAACFAIRVADSQNHRGVPLVFLKSANGEYITDSQGILAYCDPDHMGPVEFTVTSHGYAYAGGKVTLNATPGKRADLTVNRLYAAERLYRTTGQGIYRDSLLLGLKAPLAHPAISGLVMGQDSAIVGLYKGKIFWTWGDTDRPAYPLGSFRTSAAVSDLPSSGGLSPNLGVNQTYYVDANGFSKGIVEDFAPNGNPTWVGGLAAVPDATGRERLFVSYSKANSDFSSAGRGLVRFDDDAQEFKRVITDYSLTDGTQIPGGQAVFNRQASGTYVYYGTLRIAAKAESFLDKTTYEVFTGFKKGGSTELDKDASGRVNYAWRKGAGLQVSSKEALAKLGVAANQALDGHLTAVDTGKGVEEASQAVSWNGHRGRFSKIIQQKYGSPSGFGEVWYSESDTPVGPWGYARKIVTHDNYTFYNVISHPYLSPDNGRTMYFEGTYTTFLTSATPTTRYNYNQEMYRLDVDDPRLVLPVPVYDLGKDLPGAFMTKRGLRDGVPALAAAFFAPDRTAPGALATAAVGWSDSACASARKLAVGGGVVEPLFYVIDASTKPLPPGVVGLYEYTSGDGRHAYGIEGITVPAGFMKASAPLGYVFPNPVQVKLPVGDFLGDLVADAGADQCVVESAKGKGALVTLDALASRDITGQAPTYGWSLPAGAQLESGASCAYATGQTLKVRLPAGVHAIGLEARDGAGNVSLDKVIVHVSAL